MHPNQVYAWKNQWQQHEARVYDSTVGPEEDAQAEHEIERLRAKIGRLLPSANDDSPALMRRIGQLFTRWPFLGSRPMTAMLRAMGRQSTASVCNA